MIKKSTLTLLIVALFFLGGCSGSSSSLDGGEDVKGPSSGDSQTFGSLSGEDDIAAYLDDTQWNTIEMDLEKYLYGTEGSLKEYKMQMQFKDGEVTALADCFIITASYRVKDNEISFSRVSSPRPDSYNRTCREFKDADNAVSSFFSSDYLVTLNSTKVVTFEALDIEATVTLKR